MFSIVKQAAELRMQGNFDAAITLVQSHPENQTGDERFLSLLQAFYAAEEGHYHSMAKELAHELLTLEPQLRSIRPYL